MVRYKAALRDQRKEMFEVREGGAPAPRQTPYVRALRTVEQFVIRGQTEYTGHLFRRALDACCGDPEAAAWVMRLAEDSASD